jgi:hypothetical protein
MDILDNLKEDQLRELFCQCNFGLMKAGDNTYEVYGLDASGKKGESIIVKVNYTPQAVTPAQPQPSPATATPADTAPIQD